MPWVITKLFGFISSYIIICYFIFQDLCYAFVECFLGIFILKKDSAFVSNLHSAMNFELYGKMFYEAKGLLEAMESTVKGKKMGV